MKRLLVLLILAACSSGAEQSATTTEVTRCAVEYDRPYAEVKVTNTTDEAAAFDVVVKFTDGSEVLGSGYEYTQTLEPGQHETVGMANRQRDADAVDTCVVDSVKRRDD